MTEGDTLETKSELVLEFEEIKSFEFLLGLYNIIYALFSFICNRQNLELNSARIIGKVTRKNPVNGELVEKDIPTSQTLVVIDKYRENPENNEIIRKTPKYIGFSSCFEQLFKLVLENKVSTSSIHPSVTLRNLLDLKHCLNITAAFEYYCRDFLPVISSESTLEFYNDMKSLVEKYINEHPGKVGNKAKDFLCTLSPQISLKDKIIKVYEGYKGWEPAKSILVDLFGEDVSVLAEAANKWRNALAHEKREYEPSYDVITAIRLVEHLNYLIVLRSAGYTDEQIQNILKNCLSK